MHTFLVGIERVLGADESKACETSWESGSLRLLVR